jgi:predicted AlkP superfamily phosphohydrolase/phosphomutase
VRKLVLAAACATVALTPACATLYPAAYTQRVVILGIDGLDPDLAREFMRDGRLPNLAALAARGGFYELQTISAPECEAAWSTIGAGREVDTPVVTHEPAKLLLNFVPVAGETWSAARTGASFWSTAAHAGVRASVIAVPGSFPPEPLPNGELLAGPPLPDIRRTQGTYHLFSSTLPAPDEGVTANGGILRRLHFERRVAHAQIAGPLHPVSRDELTLPLTVTWNHEARSANVEIGSHAVHLREREWSRWLELDFAVNAVSRVRGFAQVFLIRAGTELVLYVSPVHWHPARPPAPISSPPAFSRELFDRLGLFRTMGWTAATAALTDERLDEAAFLDDVDRAFQDRAETILNRFDAGAWDLLVGVIDTPDRVQHMMWRLTDPAHPRYDSELARRYGTSIEQSYQQADGLLGEIMTRIGQAPDTLLLVVSDHGFHTVRSQSKWSGDHTASDPTTIAGLLVTNRPLSTDSPRAIDIAPTVLRHFGLALPADYTGKPLF